MAIDCNFYSCIVFAAQSTFDCSPPCLLFNHIMKFSNILVATTALGQCASANAVPNTENAALDSRSQESGLLERNLLERVDADELWKRKGGGAAGG